jgi:hypothetical protein
VPFWFVRFPSHVKVALSFSLRQARKQFDAADFQKRLSLLRDIDVKIKQLVKVEGK